MVLSKDKIANSMNPSSGILYRNPTTEEASIRARNQADIVKQILGSGKKIITEIFGPDMDNKSLPGIKKIRDMSEESLATFFFNMFRSRPNIFSVHIKLGEYPGAKEIRSNNKFVSAIKVARQTEFKELAASFAELFADKNLNVVEVEWKVLSSTPGNLQLDVKVLGVSAEDYANDELFSPAVGIEYFPNH